MLTKMSCISSQTRLFKSLNLFGNAKFTQKLHGFSVNTGTDLVASFLTDSLTLDPWTILIHRVEIKSVTV